ncbi:MAG TPA: hypothetical protein VN836_02500 [Verrucomicrobiae bacterium]|nr:hypothetical protein [Verrucomicrobiae bacterium]
MSKQYPYGIGPGGRFMIFSGVPGFGVAIVLTCAYDPMEHLVGQDASPYVMVGIIITLYVVSMFLSNYLPKRFVIPVGIVGWALMLSLLYWYYCFGPGAFGHHTI